MRVYSPFHLQGFGEKKSYKSMLLLDNPINCVFTTWSGSALLVPPDSQPEPQCDLSDQFPGGVQVHGGPHSLPEASQIPGGYHLHREHSCYQGERHLFGHLHPALRLVSTHNSPCLFLPLPASSCPSLPLPASPTRMRKHNISPSLSIFYFL